MRRRQPTDTSGSEDDDKAGEEEMDMGIRRSSWHPNQSISSPTSSCRCNAAVFVVFFFSFLFVLYFGGSLLFLLSLHPGQGATVPALDKRRANPLGDKGTRSFEQLSRNAGPSMTLKQAVQNAANAFAERHDDLQPFHKPVTAYLEPPLSNLSTTTSTGQGPALPLRTWTPEDLSKIEYPRVYSCEDMPAKFPIDAGPQFDVLEDGSQVVPVLRVTNVGDLIQNISQVIPQEIPHCPVAADPFLPWIHDVFLQPSHKVVQFIAHNRRRCRSGSHHTADREWFEPQVALLQSVPVERISPHYADQLAPNLWKSSHDNHHSAQRYRLATHETADEDAQYTRFICRFHTFSSTEQRVELGETFSKYPFSYELADYRKPKGNGLLSQTTGKDNPLFWTAILLFECPLPQGLEEVSSWTVPNHHHGDDGKKSMSIPLVHVDIIPIRTPVRARVRDSGFYLSSDQIGPKLASKQVFDPSTVWGETHVLPLPQASGRWENIPVCPLKQVEDNSILKASDLDASKEDKVQTKKTKPYLLSACLWSSASFQTRGKTKAAMAIQDTNDRLLEWIEFHLMVGFDHIYVYDNSGAFGNATNLQATVNLFSPSQVTWIDWPSQVCNNNIPAHDNTGERSSQYAAENSCRTRYGPRTEWLISFDTDEYLVPQGKHADLRSVVEDIPDATKIVSFPSSRGKLRYDFSQHTDAQDPKSPRFKWTNVTYLQAFNCDGSPTPRPSWAERARKQLYRPDFVLNHFVHYSTVTQHSVLTYQQAQEAGERWSRYYDPSKVEERNIDEVQEAMMIHAKSLDVTQTQKTHVRCRYDYKKHLGCFVGFPWPGNQFSERDTYNISTEMAYNCFTNPRVDTYWVPRLQDAMKKRLAAGKT